MQAKSYWIGSRGLLFLRLCVVAYFAGTLSISGLTGMIRIRTCV